MLEWKAYKNGFPGALALCLALLAAGCGPNSGSGKSATAVVGNAGSPECVGAVYPDLKTIESGTYVPLSRPLFLYVNKAALARPEVATFLRFFLKEGQDVVSQVNYVRVPEATIVSEREKLEAAIGELAVPAELKGTITIDGSSTVYPISAGISETFTKLHGSAVSLAIKKSGTGGGFKKFAIGETDISGASRPIDKKESEACAAHNIEYISLTVAIDGLTVVVNPNNRWCDCLSVEQLKALWEPGSKVKLWSDLNPSWPKQEIKLYGPDPDSGTFDYFTEVICGKSKSSRTDYNPSAEDNVLAQGVRGDDTALGYFGYAYFASNKDELKALGIVPAKKPE